MDGMFGGYIYHKNQLNVVEYTIHWMDPMGDADGDCYWVGLEANVSLFFPGKTNMLLSMKLKACTWNTGIGPDEFPFGFRPHC